MAEGDSKGQNVILGVDLLVDGTDRDMGTSLGIVLISDNELSTLTLGSLRSNLKRQLSACPRNFVFCSKESWPISHMQERDIFVTQVITEGNTIKLKKKYDKPKIGIKTPDGQAVGFIFSTFSSHIRDIRGTVYSQIFQHQTVSQTFQFLDCNGWPISVEQEDHMTVIDILNGSCITVTINTDIIPPPSPLTVARLSQPDHPPYKKHKISHHMSFQSGKDLTRHYSDEMLLPDGPQAKQILISYVRAEAAQHAVSLKEELCALGYSIYLDVDEIQSGVDWQDSLNFAVSGCEVFVPLVTGRYGETQWTNREVKLADVLGKYILPINFLSEWPPGCLAIQFATTQFIPWKPDESDGKAEMCSEGSDIRCWERRYIRRVAKHIGERIQKLVNNKDNLHTAPSLIKRKTIVQSCACVTESTQQAVTSDREGRPFIVICVHPEQVTFATELKAFLEGSDYEVWLSSSADMDLTDGVSFSQDLLREEEMGCNAERKDLSYLQQFQEKADEAGVVLVVLSEAFSRSRTCQQQMFYCEHRKRVVPILFEEFSMPGWMSMLLGIKECQGVGRPNYKATLLRQLRRALDPDVRDSPVEEINEAKIKCAVERLRQKLNTDMCVYIAGSTGDQTSATQELCRNIGENLASLDTVVMVTGGQSGAGEIMGKAFRDETTRLSKNANVWHIRHETDENEDITRHQNGVLKLGKTLYYGDSSKERENIISRAFKICILINGEGNSLKEAEMFHWNDSIVIPVMCQSKADQKHMSIQDKILEIPDGVNPSDWKLLSDQSASQDHISTAVTRIVNDLLIRQQRMQAPATPTSPRLRALASPQTSPQSIRLNMKQRTVQKSPQQPSMSPIGLKPSLATMKTVVLK